ncbi:MAG: hypothetical protein D3923_20080, partial [Candidatus Electrothrix sp. AR3]|nr:hypothetical protein [Candidatus Electrothrix sp. AR3]
TALRRTSSGGFTVDTAVAGEQLFAGQDGLPALLQGMMEVEEALGRSSVENTSFPPFSGNNALPSVSHSSNTG